MAKYLLSFVDVNDDSTFIDVHELNGIISIYCRDEKQTNTSGVCVHLDKSTAIKFAKTLRTEINKIAESEVSNG